MSEFEAMLLHKRHRMVMWCILLICAIVVYYSPIREKLQISDLLLGFTLFWTFFLLQAVLPFHRYCIGYGVSRKLNQIATKQIVNDFDLILGGFCTTFAARLWLRNFFTAAVILGASLFLETMYPSTEASLVLTTAYCVVTSNCMSTIGSIYIWLMADRKWLWYMPEESLKHILKQHRLPVTEADRIINEARNKGLLLRPRLGL